MQYSARAFHGPCLDRGVANKNSTANWYNRNMKKLPAKAHRFVMPLVLTGIMTVVVSGISTVRVAGFGGLADHWLGAWLWSWGIAYPAILCIFPLVHWIMDRIIDKRS